MRLDEFLSGRQIAELRTISSPEFREKATKLATRLRESLLTTTDASEMVRFQQVSYAELAQIADQINWMGSSERERDVSSIRVLIAQLFIARINELPEKLTD